MRHVLHANLYRLRCHEVGADGLVRAMVLVLLSAATVCSTVAAFRTAAALHQAQRQASVAQLRAEVLRRIDEGDAAMEAGGLTQADREAVVTWINHGHDPLVMERASDRARDFLAGDVARRWAAAEDAYVRAANGGRR